MPYQESNFGSISPAPTRIRRRCESKSSPGATAVSCNGVPFFSARFFKSKVGMIRRSISIRSRVATCGATWNGCVQAWKSLFASLLVPTQRFDGGARRLRQCGCRLDCALVRRVYEANFAHDLDIAQPSVLLDCLDRLVEDPVAVLATARGNEAK